MHKLKGTKLASFKLVETSVSSPDIMNEKMPRPAHLRGTTYKISPTDGECSSLYITINDIVLNEGTQFEEVRPFEIFINSKNVEHFQWVAALTRVMSAVFRKGGDVTFLVDELEGVFDPRGGYFIGAKLMDSIVAHIGSVLRDHMISLGTIEPRPEKVVESSGFPPHAQVCKKCKHKAAVMLDNCLTCLNCGDGKCG